MNAILTALLGGKIGSGEFQPQEEIAVESTPFPKPGVKEGLLGGFFRAGKTGGNILGILGDSLRAGSGLDPLYAPRVRQMREAEALQDYATDPLRAIQQYGAIDGPGAAKLSELHNENLNENDARESLIRDRNEAFRTSVQRRGLSLLKALTPETYDKGVDQIRRYYAAKGVEPDFELPATFDEAARLQPWAAEITPEQQDRLDAQREYREALINQRDRAESGRNYRARLTDNTRRSEGTANRGVRVAEGEATRTLRRELGGGRTRPGVSVEIVVDPKTGRRMVKRKQ